MHIFQGTEIASELLNTTAPILVYYDPDVDGIFSGYFVTDVLNSYNRPNMYYINENRAHGFKMSMESVARLRGCLIVAVDFSIEEELVHQIVDAGVNLVNIDHHNINNETLVYYENKVMGSRGVVINNQYCFEPKEWRFLSGAGMVHAVFSAFMPDYFNTKKHRALTGLTLLSDVRETESDLAISYLEDTFSWQDAYSGYLLRCTADTSSYTFGSQTYLDRNFIDFTFSPKLNALFRFNRGDTAIKLVKGEFNCAEISLSNLREAQKSICVDIVNRASCASRSNLTLAKVAYTGLEQGTANYANFIGLACGKILSSTGKTTVTVLCNGNTIIRGSLRGLSDNVNYLEIFRRYGVPCAGHKNAFGILSCDIGTIDFDSINEEIRMAEQGAELTYTVEDIGNLGFLVANTKRIEKMAKYNCFARNNHRIYLNCSRCSSTLKRTNAAGTYALYEIDGVQVKGFDVNITPENGGVILPMYEKGYLAFYLRNAGT